MWPLLILSIVNLSCIFERFLYWNKIKSLNKRDSKKLIEYYAINKFNIEDLDKTSSKIPLEKILNKALKMISGDKKNIKVALAGALNSMEREFSKYNELFSTTITIAPLLGLLGTVLGLINSFSFIKLGSAGINAEEVTGGISEALVSTAAGLIVAIITLLFANYFTALKKKEKEIIFEYINYFEILYTIHK